MSLTGRFTVVDIFTLTGSLQQQVKGVPWRIDRALEQRCGCLIGHVSILPILRSTRGILCNILRRVLLLRNFTKSKAVERGSMFRRGRMWWIRQRSCTTSALPPHIIGGGCIGAALSQVLFLPAPSSLPSGGGEVAFFALPTTPLAGRIMGIIDRPQIASYFPLPTWDLGYSSVWSKRAVALEGTKRVGKS